MTTRGGKGWWLAGVAVGLLVCAVGVVLLARTGLEDADRWASVTGMFLNLVGVVVAGYSAVQARRTATAVPAVGGDVHNRIGGGQFTGAVVMGRDLEQVSTTGEPAPDPGQPPLTGGPQAGKVSNTIDDGRFHGPVVMGRDMHGIVLPPPTDQRPDADGPTR
ncbi:hypothetical protein [Micromonospora sp. NBRC 101691]|uniref:hypothetical protein n=1 Tax=Micromonospora sp. NBRC 101691 TaxID=3032198 RepID=UPI0024A2CE04|nr:hypothetical protein [Micromonospora sp. NBRC 101691]GLY24924.1 hypothetical protein Misp04_46560 [Micromonospora sp. NBRC 101691]